MNDIQSVLIRLLKEIDSICIDNAIPYTLTDKTAWDAIKRGSFSEKAIDAQICIMAEDVAALRSKLLDRQPGKREVVDIPGPSSDSTGSFSYVASDTTLIDWMNSDLVSGIGVIVKPCEIRAEGLKYRLPSGALVGFPPCLLLQTNRILFDGVELSLSQDTDQLLHCLLSGSKNTKKWPHPSRALGSSVVWSVGVAYRDVLAGTPQTEASMNDLQSRWEAFQHFNKNVRAPALKAVATNDLVLELTELRYRLWQQYFPCKELLLRRWKEGDGKAVEIAMQDYISSMSDFYKRSKRAICFDRELFELAVGIIRYENKSLADSLSASVPEGHYLPLVVSSAPVSGS